MRNTDGQEINQLLSARDLLGIKVRSRFDEDLGKIIDVRYNPADGSIRYLLVAFGGLWGLGEKVFAVPYSVFSLSEREKQLYLNIEQEVFQNATPLELEDWSISPFDRWGEREVFLLNNAQNLIRWSGQ